MSQVRIVLLIVLALAVGAAAIYTVMMPTAPQSRTASPAPDRPAAAPAAPAPAAPPVAPAATSAVTSPAKPAPALATEAAPAVAPAAPTATLKIESDVPDASVFVDRVYLGTAPITVPNLTPGTHRLNASAAGYDGIAETIEILAGERNILLQFKAIRLDVRVDVTHKHVIGSCAGTLTATPQGVTYATTHKEDGFHTTLADIATLELDYLAKNLRVRLKSGKTYNFTETGGGADLLYAFQRDVDKARKQKS